MVKFNVFKNRNGFTVTEALVASVIVVISALAMTSAYVNYFKTGSEYKVINAFNEIESTIISALQDQEFIRPYAVQLASGVAPSNLIIRSFSNPDNSTNILAQNNQTIHVGDNLKTCSFDPEKCFIKVDFRVQCQSYSNLDSTPSNMTKVDTLHSCSAAYKIEINPLAKNKKFLKPLTNIKNIASPGFNPIPSDFTVPINFQNFLRSTADDCYIGNSNSDSSKNRTTIVTGMNRETGEVYCARLPDVDASSPLKNIPVGLIFTYTGSHGGKFSLESVPSMTMKCPPNYSLHRFSVSQMDSREADATECIFITKDTVPWPGESGRNSVTKRVCPKHYVVDNIKTNCSQMMVSSTPGECTHWEPCQVEVPPKSGKYVTNIKCTSSTYSRAAPPIQGTGATSSSGQDATCGRILPAFYCDPYDEITSYPTYEIDVSMNGECRLNEPRTMPALRTQN